MGRSAPFPLDRHWPIDTAICLACTLEAAAPKAGNVHPLASFGDMQFPHFVVAGNAITRALTGPDGKTVGSKVLAAVDAMRQAAAINTSLGTILLLAPLVQAIEQFADSGQTGFQAAVRRVLDGLTPADAADVYQAIQLAQPGGLGTRETDDVRGAAPADLIQAMQQVASFDAVARQYVCGFNELFQRWLPLFDQLCCECDDVATSIVRLQLSMLADQPDGLIHRKAGSAMATRVQAAAQDVIHDWTAAPAGPPMRVEQLMDNASFQAFDRLLRAEGNRLNPGTTADLIAAVLFIRLVDLPG